MRAGGTLVGIFLTGWPGDGLREVFGVWAEEIGFWPSCVTSQAAGDRC